MDGRRVVLAWIFGGDFAAARQRYLDEAPALYPSLFACEGPEIPGTVLGWHDTVSFDCNTIDTHHTESGARAYRTIMVEQAGRFSIMTSGVGLEIVRCTDASLATIPNPDDSDVPADSCGRRWRRQVWTEVDCASVCAERGPAWVAAGCSSLECVCEPADPSACTPGERRCIDESTVELCSDTQVLQPFACEGRCAEQGLASLGCMTRETDIHGDPLYDCWCTLDGTPCEPGTMPACVDEHTLGICSNGVWSFEDCLWFGKQCVPWDGVAMCEP